jgi:tRNA1(Val) A37 N6-methylase TrmN6
MKVKINSNESLEDLQCNGLFILQEKDGYRFTSDAVALANFVKVKNNGRVVDLCSGSGVIGILILGPIPEKILLLINVPSGISKSTKYSSK